MELDINPNYIFAFLHGVIHPATLIFFVNRKKAFCLFIVGIGIITLGGFWLLSTIMGIPFPIVKTLLSLTSVLGGFIYVLGRGKKVAISGVVVALALAGFSHGFISLDIYRPNWSIMFPLLVCGQLLIYFGGFFLTRRVAT